jgi:PhnB protein
MSGITIHMIVPGAERASAWYSDVFGATEHGRITLPDGRLIQVEVHVSGSVLMLADEFPEHGAVRPPAEITSAVAFYLAFDDVDAVWQKAIAAGAAEHRPLIDTPFGERDGQILDPFGYRWGLTQHLRDVSHEEMTRAAAQVFG